MKTCPRSRNVFILDNPLQFKLKDEDYLKQNSNGDTVLHLILLNQNLKLQAKKKYLRKLSEDFPERLLVKNNFQHLPLHVAAITDTYGQRLYRHLLDLTIEASGHPEIFYEDMEVAVKCLEMAIMNNQGLSEEYLRNFLKVVESHGHRLLIEMIKHSQQLKGIRSILLLGVSINPNQFYGGQNAFLAAVRYDVSHFYQSHNESYSKLKLLLNHHPIEDPNACDETKTSLFMYIVGFTRDNELVKSLINLGADCKARNSENLSCLHFAARNKKNEEILNILLQNGADPSILSDKNELAIDFAIKNDILHAVKSLISFVTVDDLKRKSLIQSCTHSYLPEVYNLIWNLYDFHHIDVDINAINENGDSFVMSLMDKFNFKQLETVLKERFDDINFDLINSNGETFTHHLVLHSSQIHEISQLFKDFPLLIDIVNKQINIADKENHLPMDRYFFCFQTECVDELCRNEFLKYLTKENFQQNMHKFIDGVLSLQNVIELYPHIFDELNSNQSFVILDKLSCNIKAFEIVIEKFSDKLPDIKALDGGNILHFICEKNNSEFIDLVCKSLSEISIKKLSNETNVNGKKPIELLNEQNLTIFSLNFDCR
ncbi:CLUMA_CG016226, isoform A [Clunio marinus]|uniref:CLUMA_CG016226, isoform A n=1 Tax=Clunio marinus TaxID=568069 RepID=A0A1J1ISA0_9DIPT|nr:CLUMA_CG016226, isoform A [Clunio marinus]